MRASRFIRRVIPIQFVCSIAVIATGCQTLSLDGLETTIENEWHPGGVGIVHRYSRSGPWSHESVTGGDGVFVRLYESNHISGTFDGTSYHEITFQLPSKVRDGDRYVLRSAVSERSTRPDKTGSGESATMRSGEMTALQFGNPAWGQLGEEVDCEVNIIAIGEKQVEIHLRLKAQLHPNFSFDMDRNFILEVVPPPRRRAPSLVRADLDT